MPRGFPFLNLSLVILVHIKNFVDTFKIRKIKDYPQHIKKLPKSRRKLSGSINKHKQGKTSKSKDLREDLRGSSG